MTSHPESDVAHEEPSFDSGVHSKELLDDGKTVTVTFEENDSRNPMNFSQRRKWVMTVMGCSFTILVAASATSYPMGFPTMIPELNCTEYQATLGLSIEEFGRQPLYIVSTIVYMLMHLMMALAPNIQTVIVARLLQGAVGSTGATVVAGTITDLWATHEVGLPMAIFSTLGIAANGMGAVAAGWVDMDTRLGWRWIQWLHLIITGVYCILVPIILKETRASILLLKMADELRKKNPGVNYRVKAYEIKPSFRTLMWISCSRPIYLLCTEPIVISNSLWIGFAWGIFYCMIQSVPGLFETLYMFNNGAVGTVFATMVVGSVIGFFTNLCQERLYARNFSKRGPEGRLYLAFVAAFLFPVAMFIYAWTARPDVHWIAPVIGITIYMWATYTIYLAVFAYLADCYGVYASSALAGQSLSRNIMGAAFPLFTQVMFRNLTYKWANTLFACIAVLMIPIPYILFVYGPIIRGWSKFSQKLS
ncbi:major facilitator superfamily domain-containing protein [Collybia nuda]|uniref:Major facilitator superfamily domain-containing protein n=1 Tax=Collybia nuda TaxID=64659 RepID=A0A9P6CCW1_9AGAR|nr:major facilitator superfamily domain-containing protein [Collybia nuda]